MLEKQAISRVPREQEAKGFISQLFLVPKKGGGKRPIINLKGLNTFVEKEHFKMESSHMIKDILKPGDWMTKAAGAISMAGGNIPVQLPPIWPDLSTSGLYQDPEGSNDHLKVIGSKNDHIHRRHSYHGRDGESGKGAHSSSNFPVGELRVHYQSPQVRPETPEGDRFLGSHSELHQNGGKNAGRKDQTHSPRCQKDSGKGIMPGNRIISLVGEAERCASGNPTSPPLLQEPATLPEHSPEWGEGLLSPCPPNSPSKGRVRMVARTSHQMEWAQSPLKEARHDHRDRCLNHRLGSIMSGNNDRGTLVPRGKTKAYKLLGVASSSIGSEVLCQGQGKHPDPSQDGQHYSPHLYKQVGRDSFTGAEPPDQRSVDVVPEQEYQPAGNTSSRDKKHHSGRGISCDEGQVRLDALSQGLQQDQSGDGTTTSGPVCISADTSATRFCELETRSRGDCNRCLHIGLEAISGVCKPTLELGGQSTVTGQGAEGTTSPCMEVSDIVPNPPGDGNPGTPSVTSQSRIDPADPQGQQTGHQSNISRMGYLRQRFRTQNLSAGASRLLLSSWRQKTAKSYDSLFNKWVRWCNERNSDPVSGDINEVINFLAALYDEGYQYRSLNAYRSAISSVHEKIDGYDVGQHPMVTRLIKGAFQERPPQPRYTETWNVATVTTYLESLGDNEKMSLNDLSYKTVMLMALTRPSRSADIANLSLGHRKYSPEGVSFQPTQLAKQSRAITEFFFPGFSGNPLLCPVTTLRAYEDRTKERRGDDNRFNLFIALIRPYRPVSSSTIARWIKSTLTKSGINTDIFKSHSVRSAAVSSAANAGVTISEIISAADWSNETVFQKFYYKPEAKNNFGCTVLSTLPTTK